MKDIWSSIYSTERYDMTALKLSYVGLLPGIVLLRGKLKLFWVIKCCFSKYFDLCEKEEILQIGNVRKFKLFLLKLDVWDSITRKLTDF